jgi:hypothetical protein
VRPRRASADARPLLLYRSRGRGKILESGTMPEEPAVEGGVTAGGRPMDAHARVPENSRRLAS